jgi:hypothetical protein
MVKNHRVAAAVVVVVVVVDTVAILAVVVVDSYRSCLDIDLVALEVAAAVRTVEPVRTDLVVDTVVAVVGRKDLRKGTQY